GFITRPRLPLRAADAAFPFSALPPFGHRALPPLDPQPLPSGRLLRQSVLPLWPWHGRRLRGRSFPDVRAVLVQSPVQSWPAHCAPQPLQPCWPAWHGQGQQFACARRPVLSTPRLTAKAPPDDSATLRAVPRPTKTLLALNQKPLLAP